MPIYEYVCKSCGHEFEEMQRFSDAPLERCPSCQEESSVQRKVSKSAFHLKGGGWYKDGYGSSKPDSSDEGNKDSKNNESETEAKKSESSGEVKKAENGTEVKKSESSTESSSKESKPVESSKPAESSKSSDSSSSSSSSGGKESAA
jgi:putative FmdB family regulatory protein